jgi:hypothetical protein
LLRAFVIIAVKLLFILCSVMQIYIMLRQVPMLDFFIGVINSCIRGQIAWIR